MITFWYISLIKIYSSKNIKDILWYIFKENCQTLTISIKARLSLDFLKIKLLNISLMPILHYKYLSYL